MSVVNLFVVSMLCFPAQGGETEYKIVGVDLKVESPVVSKGIVLSWVRLLRSVGVPSIREGGSATSPTVWLVGPHDIWVTATIQRDASLRIDKYIVRFGDRSGLRAVLEKLRREGPLAFAPTTEHWGLPAPLLKKLMEWLAVPAKLDYEETPLKQVLDDLDKRVEPAIEVAPEAEKIVSDAVVTVEMKSVSAGTACATVLGAYGLAFEPRRMGATKIVLHVAPADAIERRWPVGWRPTVSPGQAVPDLFRKVTIVPQRVALAQLIGAVASYCKTPVLADQLLLKQRNIDPATTVVSVGGTNMPLALLFSRALREAGLKYVVRVDEAGRPIIVVIPRDAPAYPDSL